MPFWPGGLDNVKSSEDTLDFIEGSSQLRTVAPGLSRGLRLPGQSLDDTDPDVVGLGSISQINIQNEDAPVKFSVRYVKSCL